jgi:hypothetical protein
MAAADVLPARDQVPADWAKILEDLKGLPNSPPPNVMNAIPAVPAPSSLRNSRLEILAVVTEHGLKRNESYYVFFFLMPNMIFSIMTLSSRLNDNIR